MILMLVRMEVSIGYQCILIYRNSLMVVEVCLKLPFVKMIETLLI